MTVVVVPGARWWRAARRRWRALLAAAALLCALLASVPARLVVERHFPAHAPALLAHALADFSNQPDIESWWVDEDHSNYTTWRYAVSFTCGARCAGRASVLAHDEPRAAPQHGRAARRHAVRARLRACTAPPLLPWPRSCDELEIVAVVSGSGSKGALLRAEWRGACGALGWAAGACQRRLRARADRTLARLQQLHTT